MVVFGENVKQERLHVKIQSLVVEEELGEQAEILRVDLFERNAQGSGQYLSSAWLYSQRKGSRNRTTSHSRTTLTFDCLPSTSYTELVPF